MLSTLNKKIKNFHLTCIGEEKSSSQSKPRRPASRDQHSCCKSVCKHEALSPSTGEHYNCKTKLNK